MTVPTDLETCAGQTTLRIFAWHLVEELTEALDERPHVQFMSAPKFLGELADCFHFAIELLVRSGMKAEDFQFILEEPTNSMLAPIQARDKLIQNLGRAIHQLKFKIWKQDPKPTTIREYHWDLKVFFNSFLQLIRSEGYSHRELLDAYFAKAKTNHQRIAAGV